MPNDDDDAKAFECPITHEPMADPVTAADGHTYERAAIARWLSENQTSPVTNQRLPHKNLLPNRHLKAMITAWRDEQKGDAGKRKRLKAHLMQLGCALSAQEAHRAIELLSAFVEREAIVVQAGQLLKTRRCLQADDEVWCDGVEQALDCLLYTSPSPRDGLLSRMPSSA